VRTLFSSHCGGGSPPIPPNERGSVLAMLIAALTSLGKTVSLIVAITFILWALVTAIFVPKRREGFPRRLDAYIVVSVILFVAQMSTVLWAANTQEVEEAHAAETPSQPGGGGGGTETAPTTTTTAPATGDATAGKQVFETAGCTSCHTLADAGATGTVGPNLDQAKPPASLVVMRVTNGKGVMPSFKGQLSEQQIQDVAAYVSSVAGQS
jgi:mono/diheme cytochrome c family protein